MLRDRIDAVPDATIAELQTWLAAEHRIIVGHGTVWRAIQRVDRTRKKEPDRDRPARRAAGRLAGGATGPDPGRSGGPGRNQHADHVDPHAWAGTEGAAPGRRHSP